MWSSLAVTTWNNGRWGIPNENGTVEKCCKTKAQWNSQKSFRFRYFKCIYKCCIHVSIQKQLIRRLPTTIPCTYLRFYGASMLNPWTQDHARAVQGVRARDYASDFARESALRKVWRSHWNLFLKGMSLVGLVSFGHGIFSLWLFGSILGYS